MKHPRLLVLGGAIAALGLMTVLSAYLGHVVPQLISKKYTQLLAGVLFILFGVKMGLEAKDMSGNEGQEELEEITHELDGKEDATELEALEGGGEAGTTEKPSRGLVDSIQEGVTNVLGFFFTPIFVQTFIMTFLAEWGDRSQIASMFL